MDVLILVDIQIDFLPGGALPVPHGDEVVPVANRLMKRMPLVVATQDWHPREHQSFASNHPDHKPFDRIQLAGQEQVLWPDHCVQSMRGAEFAPGLEQGPIEAIFRKGTDPQIDSYSGFFDNARRKATGLADYLRGRSARRLFIAGLAAEYCVLYTLLDALDLGFEATLVRDGTRALSDTDFAAARPTILERGGRLLMSRDLV
ncbi:MAG: bifunctional nicotinamidase/pyrazinamidase [Candidatus Aminicenantes bacterium]|nr:bifunctional nicotinamidase/pyrazinamidase [Candidatus Aminicenantes bacterium]